MDAFLTKERIGIFAKLRNDPNEPKALSGLSPYIHFGQLGMQRAALRCIGVKKQYRVRLRGPHACDAVLSGVCAGAGC